MTHRGPFQPLLFYGSVILVEFDASQHNFNQFQGQSAGSYCLFNL